MQKFFVNEEQIKENHITMIGTDVNHILHVLRLKQEDEIQICSNQTSQNYKVRIQIVEKDKIECEIIEKIESEVESEIDLTIFQGLPKADKMEWIIQKTTEIGVKAIVPVEMERSIVKIEGKDKIKKIERWQKIAEVAAKQSKRDKIPEIKNIISMKEVYSQIENYQLFIVAYEEEKEMTLKKLLQENKLATKIAILVGPEGGIDKKEMENLIKHNSKIVTLGNRILRTETAPIVMSSNILYELEK